MKESDKISVLVCVHSTDRQHDVLLQRALESLVRQTYAEFQTIVVMDECWEDTKSIVESYGEVLDIKFYERKHKQGLAAAKNYGIEKCNGDWIAYLDADDQWLDCKLEFQRKWLLQNTDIDFCGTGAWDLVNDIMLPNCFEVNQYNSHDEIVSRIATENVMCHGSMMIRLNALKALKGYNQSILHKGQEDWELWIRAIKSGFKFGKVSERLYVYSMGTSVER